MHEQLSEICGLIMMLTGKVVYIRWNKDQCRAAIVGYCKIDFRREPEEMVDKNVEPVYSLLVTCPTSNRLYYWEATDKLYEKLSYYQAVSV